jgi:hypothetical protein
MFGKDGGDLQVETFTNQATCHGSRGREDTVALSDGLKQAMVTGVTPIDKSFDPFIAVLTRRRENRAERNAVRTDEYVAAAEGW